VSVNGEEGGNGEEKGSGKSSNDTSLCHYLSKKENEERGGGRRAANTSMDYLSKGRKLLGTRLKVCGGGGGGKVGKRSDK